MADAEMTERPVAADEVELILQRAAPGEVEKEELLDSGFSNDEIREAIAYLENQGTIEGTATGYLYVEDGRAAAEPEPAPSEEELPEEAGPALTAHVRSHFEVVCSFGRKPGETDDASLAKAQTIGVEIGNALAMAMPKLDFHVSVSQVDAFDNPRPLFPTDD